MSTCKYAFPPSKIQQIPRKDIYDIPILDKGSLNITMSSPKKRQKHQRQ